MDKTLPNPAAIDNFSAQYKDPRWFSRRTEIIAIDRYLCRRCGASKTLEVHHISYQKGKMAWEYDDDCLVTLCKSCHMQIHHYKDELNQYLSVLMWNWCLNRDKTDATYYNAMEFIRHIGLMSPEVAILCFKVCLNTAVLLSETDR